MKKSITIPDLPQEEIYRLAKTIKPVMIFDGKLHFIKECDPIGESYIWSAEKADPAEGLVVVSDIRTYHRYGYYGMFKPSIGEVIRQIPTDLLATIKAFEILLFPKNASDLNDEIEAINQGFHVATTRLYL